MRTEKYYTVRNELKKLRMLDRSLEALRKEDERLERAGKLLGRGRQPAEARVCESIRKEIEEGNALKNKYYPLISRLEPIDRIIILEGFIAKKPYWKLGSEIGYSKDGIQKRVYLIIERLSAMIEDA